MLVVNGADGRRCVSRFVTDRHPVDWRRPEPATTACVCSPVLSSAFFLPIRCKPALNVALVAACCRFCCASSASSDQYSTGSEVLDLAFAIDHDPQGGASARDPRRGRA